MPVPSTISDISTNPLLNSPAGTDPVSNTLDDYLRATQAILKSQFAAGAAISVTGSTITIPETGNYFNVSAASTQSVTGFSSNFNGRSAILRFNDSNITLVASGSLILPQGANFACTEGDILTFAAISSGTWTLVAYSNAARLNISQTWTASQTFNAIVASQISSASIISQAETGTAIALTTPAIDLSLGTVFSGTIVGSTTFSVSNVPVSGKVGAFMLDLTNGGAYTVTWWSGVVWQNGIAPTLTVSGRDLLGFITRDGGTTWNGLLIGQNMKPV